MIIFINGDDSYHHHHFGKDLFDSIRSSIFLGDSKPGRRRLFTFKICRFVVGLCTNVQFVPKKKSPLKNFSFLAHPSLYLFLIRHISFSWELPLFAWVSKWYHDTIMFTYNMFKIAISQKPASITFVFSLQLLPAAKIHIFSTSNPRSLISEYFRLIWYLWSGNRFTRSKQIGVTRARWSGNHTLPDILQHFEDVKTLF